MRIGVDTTFLVQVSIREHPGHEPARAEMANLRQAQAWWNASETEQVSTTAESMAQFWRWMVEFGLGRKRLLDTLLAATYASHDVHAILSSDARDYRAFGGLHAIVPG